jgi:hypothetical protein
MFTISKINFLVDLLKCQSIKIYNHVKSKKCLLFFPSESQLIFYPVHFDEQIIGCTTDIMS